MLKENVRGNVEEHTMGARRRRRNEEKNEQKKNCKFRVHVIGVGVETKAHGDEEDSHLEQKKC